MKNVLMLTLFFIVARTAIGQGTTIPFTPDFEMLVENGSTPDWLRVQEDYNFSKEDFLSENKETLGFDLNYEFELLNSKEDKLGDFHHKYQLLFKGIIVDGSEFLLHERQGRIFAMNGKLPRNLDLSVSLSVDTEVALDGLLNQIKADKYGWEEYLPGKDQFESEYPKADVVITRKDNQNSFANENMVLAYRFLIVTIKPEYSKKFYYIDVDNGKIIKSETLIMNDGACNCCNGTTTTLYHGPQDIRTHQDLIQFQLLDNCRGGGIETLSENAYVKDPNNNFVNNHKEIAAASAHWAAEVSYDYFLSKFGLNSFDGNGAKIDVNTSSGTDQASWNGSQLSFGKSGSL
ncbi:MAG: bacillolysin [Salibacteraceae bacterium]|jgi:bacillolysin